MDKNLPQSDEKSQSNPSDQRTMVAFTGRANRHWRLRTICLTWPDSGAQSKYRIAAASSTGYTASVHRTQQCVPFGYP